jgi:hypothetical protein
MTICFLKTHVTRRLRIVAQVGIVVLGVFLYSTSNAQVTFTQILNNKVIDPIGGNFSPDASSPPSIDGASVVFRNIGSGGPELWSSNLDGSTLTNLATTQSVLPGLLNAGTLSGLSQAPAIARDGTVLFSASDHLCLTSLLVDCGGIWSTAAVSGAFSLIANGGILDLSDLLEDFYFGLSSADYDYALDDVSSKVAFEAHNSVLGLIGSTHGIYLENLNGTGLATIADDAGSFIVHPSSADPITDFFDPAISNGVVAFVGKAADGLGQGIYTFPATGTVLKDGSPAFTQLLSSIGKLPGDPNGGDNFINILTPTLQLVGHQLTFVATNALTNPTYAGIFAVDTITGVVTKIVSSADSLSGLGTLLTEFSYSVNEAGQLVFKATDGINAGYFLANIVGGLSQITQIVLSGQTINVSGHDVTVLLSDIVDLGKYQLDGLNFVFQIVSDSEEIVVGSLQGLLPTPTPTATATGTPAGTPTATGTAAATATPTATPTAAGTIVATATSSATPTPTRSATATSTQTATSTPTGTSSSTPTVTRTPTATPTSTVTATSTSSSTPTVTKTATATSTQTATSTATSSPTATATPTPSIKPTPSSTATPTPEPTAVPVKLLVRPRKLNFGPQQMNTAGGSQIITVTNRSKKKRSIAVTMEGTKNLGPFVITSDHCTGTVLPFRGSSCQVTVAFQPNALGKVAGNITVMDNARKDPQKVKLLGFGMNQ